MTDNQQFVRDLTLSLLSFQGDDNDLAALVQQKFDELPPEDLANAGPILLATIGKLVGVVRGMRTVPVMDTFVEGYLQDVALRWAAERGDR